MSQIIYSFDILDTCLCRTCGEPYAVFDLLARDVLGTNITNSQLADFRLIRTKGEKIARQKSIAEDVTIEQIYQECDFSGLTDLTNDKIIIREIQIEKNVLRPIYNTLEKVKKIHSQGKPIVYISDMYLSSAFFVEILNEFGFWKEGDKIYVSSEIGKSKVSGNLFKYVANDLNVSFWRWSHYGDNRHSDVNVPRRLGIFAHHIKTEYSYFQKKLREKNYCIHENYMGRIAGISRSLCLMEPENIYTRFAADLIAPIYISFLFSVLEDAKVRGIRKLFFLARDGYILYQLAKHISSMYPLIEFKYLYVSRKSLYLPALDDVSLGSLLNILPCSNNNSSNEYFDNLQLDKLLSGSSNLDDHNFSKMSDLVQHNWREQQKNVLKYFLQEGVASYNSDIAILDIRGSRKCQRSINHILNRAGYSNVFAYYLEATANRVIPSSNNEYRAFFFSDIKANPNYKNMDISIFMFESYFCLSRQQRTKKYHEDITGKISPVFEKESFPKFYEEIERINSDVCLKFCDEYICNKLCDMNSDILNFSLSILSDFGINPKREYLKALVDIRFSESVYRNTNIIGFLTPNNLIQSKLKWKRGSLVYTCPLLLILYDYLVKMYNKVRYLCL